MSDPGPGTLPILYQDAALIAVHKPSGLLVHRTGLDRHETRFALQMVRDMLGHPVWPVHRLDKGTSGILLFARDREVGAALGARFASGGVEKTYLAVVRGHPPLNGVVDHPLTPLADPHAGLPAGRAAQPAVTRFRRLAATELPHAVDRYPTSRYALVELEPLTGRRHQLRRHMKYIAHPIIGDATHGKGRHNRLFQDLFGSHRLLLAAVTLAFRHPVNDRWLRLSAPPAADFAEVLRRLGWECFAGTDKMPDSRQEPMP